MARWGCWASKKKILEVECVGAPAPLLHYSRSYGHRRSCVLLHIALPHLVRVRKTKHVSTVRSRDVSGDPWRSLE